MDDEDLSRSPDSVSTSEEYEVIEDSVPRLQIIGDGGEVQLKKSIMEILCEEMEQPTESSLSNSVCAEDKKDSVSLGDICILPSMSSTLKHGTSEYPLTDMKHSMYTFSPSPTDEDLMSVSASLDYGEYTVFDGLIYLGCAVVPDPSKEQEVQKIIAVLNQQLFSASAVELHNQSPPQLMYISLSLPVNSEGFVTVYEQCSCNELLSFPIVQIKVHVAGNPDTKEANCLALIHESSESSVSETTISQCHVFRCEVPEVVSKIIQCLTSALKKVPKLTASLSDPSFPEKNGTTLQPMKSSRHTYVFESVLEFKEEDAKGSYSCPKEKDYFKLRCKLEKTVLVKVKQASDNASLGIERCFGLLISPGRNVRNSDMQLIEMVSFNNSVVGEKSVCSITGIWDPNEPVFEILNKETPKDTRVYLTVAVDLVISGIQEPVRFIIETKAKILPQNDRFWYFSKKTLQEQFYLQLQEIDCNGNGDFSFQVVNLDSATRIQRRKQSLKLNLSKTVSKSDIPSSCSPGDQDSDSDNDEPLLSGTGEVSKDCTESELEGWSEVLMKWRTNLTQRPRHLTTLVRRGIPEALRGEVWQLLAGCYDHRTIVDTYKSLIKKDSSCESVIQRDINRTFPGHELFKEKGGLGQDTLYKICKAYSVYDPEIGYCQGLSFLVAALLLHMPEEQAFGVFVKIMFDYNVRNMFKNSFEDLHLRFYQLQRLIEDQMPELQSHFQDLGIEVHMFASQWFLTLFTAKFPLVVVFFIIDLFLLDAMDVIFQVALALLMLSKKELLALDFEGVLKHFRVSLPKKYRTEDSARVLLQTAVKVKVKKLKKYQKEYLALKERENIEEDPLKSLQKENQRLLKSNLHLDQENDDLTFQLITTKLQLQEHVVQAEEKTEALKRDLLSTRAMLSETEEVKQKLEIEVSQLKEMCRREMLRSDNENSENSMLLTKYKQLCDELKCRVKSLEDDTRRTFNLIKLKIEGCKFCSKFLEGSNPYLYNSEFGNSIDLNDCFLKFLKDDDQCLEKVKLELSSTEAALIEAQCKNQALTRKLNVALSELQALKQR